MRTIRSFALAGLAAAVLAAPQARAESHCWCKIVKSDCGDCNTSCGLVHDFGAVAEFGFFQLHKDAICTAACNDKLAGMTEAGVCSDLAANLHVPMPWGGEVHACWNVGTGGQSAGNRTRVSCSALPPPPSYPPPGAPYWRVTLFDDFKGKPANATPEEASCYDRPPKCMAMYLEGPQDCPAAAAANLKNLNKCLWTVLHKSSWMSQSFNSFDPREVSVDAAQGLLVLSAHAVHPDGSYQPAPRSHVNGDGQVVSDHPHAKPKDWEPGYDCAWVPDPWNGHPLRYKCPVISGALISMDLSPDGPKGFIQKYGRFEVRARLPYGPGSFPAHWMLPQSGPWPGAGELDIMEIQPAADHVWQTLHTGDCMPGGLADLDPEKCKSGGGVSWHLSKDGGKIYPRDLPNTAPFWSAFHTFAVEWDAGALRFWVDGKLDHEIKDLDYIRGTRGDIPHHWWNKKKWEAWLPAHVPDRPFFWILNSTVHEENGKLPDPADFVPQQHSIDYVKASARCLVQADFCPQGGDFVVSSNTCAIGGPRPSSYPSPCTR